MDSAEFVKLVKRIAVDSTLEDSIRSLRKPTQPDAKTRSSSLPVDQFRDDRIAREAKEKLQREWFQRMNASDQEIAISVFRECTEAAVFYLFCMIDGVSGSVDHVFELVEVVDDEQDERTVLNLQNTDFLHDLFSMVCVDDEEPRERSLT